MVQITQTDLDFYEEQGYLILRGAFSPARIQSLIGAIERLMDRALAGQCEIGWIDQNRRLLQRTGGLLSPDKYDPAYGEWLDQELASHLESLIAGGEVRHSLFGMMASGGGQAYQQSWHRDLGKPGAPDEAAYMHRHHGHFARAWIFPGIRSFFPSSPVYGDMVFRKELSCDSIPYGIGCFANSSFNPVFARSACGIFCRSWWRRANTPWTLPRRSLD